MYGKVSYWSINYIQQELDKSKKKFSDYYSEYKTHSSYEQDLQYWITKYDSIENNDYIAQYFKNLLINTQNDNIPKLKSFYIE